MAPTATAYPLAARYAAANTAILLIAVVACLTRDGLATAIVIPITVVSLLSQFDAAASTRAALRILITNITGGLAASVAFTLLQVRPSHIFLFLLVLLAGLVFGGRAAMRQPAAKLYAGALTIFLLVFGTGVSPLPGSAADLFHPGQLHTSGHPLCDLHDNVALAYAERQSRLNACHEPACSEGRLGCSR